MAEGIPINEVKQMKAQGMDNNRIIQTLQADGYTSTQIFDAMSQAERQPTNLKEAGVADLSEPAGFQGGQMSAQQDYAEPSSSFPTQEYQSPVESSQPSELMPSNEELIEAIIDEKWNDLVDDINKIIDWKNRADSRLSAIETNIKNLRAEFSNLHQGVLGRISDYDKNMLDVGAELKAMETMFQKVLPTFLQNVQKLDTIANKMGPKKKKAKF